MATEAVRRRARAEAAGRVARQRRERVLLGTGILLLVGLLAVEGPKTLSKLHASSPAPLPTATATSMPSSSGSTAAASASAALKTVSRYRSKDPFEPQIAAISGGSPTVAVLASKPPKVRSAHFVKKDPFAGQVGVSTGTPPPPVTATPPVVTGPAPLKHESTQAKSARVAKGSTPAAKAPATSGPGPQVTPSVTGFVVVVASVPVAQGILAAKRAALTARTRGVARANILFSSRYPALRSGFYAVYSGPYRTSAAALKALGLVRSSGYQAAYTRLLGP
jgi:hypothetical protein